MPRHWFVGSVYSALAILNVYHRGVFNLYWAPWTLLAAGAFTLVYTETEDGEKKTSKLEFSSRNKASLAATALGCAEAGSLHQLSDLSAKRGATPEHRRSRRGKRGRRGAFVSGCSRKSRGIPLVFQGKAPIV